MTENFSVIIPLYNKEREIKRAVRSVLSQTVKDFELIIIDDGSTDNGPARVREFNDPRIKLISQENRGVSAARNRGIAEAKNELISFLDADDEWTTDYLETIRRLRRKYPEAGLYATNYQFKKPQGYFKSPKIKGIPAPPWEGVMPDYFKPAYLGQPPVFTSATTIPKQILRIVGNFKEGEVLGEDIDLWARIALEHPVCFTRKFCSIYFLDSNNRACITNIPQKPFPFIKTAASLIKSQQVNSTNIQSLKEYVAKLEFQRIKQNIVAGKKKEARKILGSFSTKRFHVLVFYYLWSVIPYKFTITAMKLNTGLASIFTGKFSRKF